MPYIPKGARERLAYNYQPMDVGELNYCLSSVVTDYILDQGGPSYKTYCGVVGVLETMKLEIYRRLVTIYEEGKIAQNGDVFPIELTCPGGPRGR